MKTHKTYTGAAIVAIGGIAGFFSYPLGNMLIAVGFAIIAIGLRHAYSKKN